MRTTLIVGDKYVSTLGNLAAEIGWSNIVFHYGLYAPGDDGFPSTFCLCPVDHELTQERANVKIRIAES